MTKYQEQEVDEEYKEEPREPCPVCGRLFVLTSLTKHKAICVKNAKKKRTVFDSAKQRVQGDELTYDKIKAAQKQPNRQPGQNWRATHEQLVASLQNAREAQAAINKGGPLPPPPPPVENPDYVKCHTCGRSFNETAAARHIPFCAEKSRRSSVKGAGTPSTGKKTSTAIRSQYKVPPKPRMANSAAQTLGHSNSGGVSSKIPNNPLKGTLRATPITPGLVSSDKTLKGRKAVKLGVNNSAAETNEVASATNVRPAAVQEPTTSDHQFSGEDWRDVDDDTSFTKIREAQENYEDSYSNGHEVEYYEARAALGSGRALRTGKSPKSYEDAKRDVCQATSRVRGQKAFLPSNCHISRRRTPPGGFARSPVLTRQLDGDHIHDYNYDRPPEPSCRSPALATKMSKFCHECGHKYPLATARFCCDCGMKRFIFS